MASCYAVQGIEETRYAVEERAGSWVKGHIVEGGDCKENAEVTCIKKEDNQGKTVSIWERKPKSSKKTERRARSAKDPPIILG